MGWQSISNGELILRAEEASFDLLLSTDQNIRYQQDLSNRKIAIVVLTDQQWPNVRLHLETIAVAINASTPGSYVEVEIPRPPKKPFTRS